MKFYKNMQSQTNDNFRRHFPLKWRQVISITTNVQQNRLCYTCTWSRPQEIMHLSLERQRFLLLLQGLVIARQQPVIPCLVPAAPCLFESTSFNTLMPAAMCPTTQSILKSSCSSPKSQQKYLSFLSSQGCSAPKFQQDCWMWALDHGCSATYSASYIWIWVYWVWGQTA